MSNSGGGYGRGPHGGMPHGGSEPELFNAEDEVVYPPVSLGVPLCSIPLDEFSGELQTGLLEDSQGQVFISPALLEPNSGNDIDLIFLQARVVASDSYETPSQGQSPNTRPFLLGPPPAVPTLRAFPPDYSASYAPVLNSSISSPIIFALLNTKPQVKGVMHNTLFPFDDTVILY